MRNLPTLCLVSFLSFSTGSGFSPSYAEGQVIRDEGGNLFMEELAAPSTTRRKSISPPLVDYAEMGISQDAKGRIIPLIQRGKPAVMENQSTVTIERSAAYIYTPVFNPYGFDYGWRPNYIAVPVYTQANTPFSYSSTINYDRSEASSASAEPFSIRQSGIYQNSGAFFGPSLGGAWYGRRGSIWLPSQNTWRSDNSIRRLF